MGDKPALFVFVFVLLVSLTPSDFSRRSFSLASRSVTPGFTGAQFFLLSHTKIGPEKGVLGVL